MKLGLSLPIHSEVRELRELLASDTGIAEAHILLTEVDDLGFHRTFSGIVYSHFGLMGFNDAGSNFNIPLDKLSLLFYFVFLDCSHKQYELR